MCGICGIYKFDKNKKINRKILNKITDIMKHRGPDDRGIFIDKNVGLGHRRLSIIDLSKKAKQPMCNEDKTIWITYNGEIYNYKDIKKQLEFKGHKFRSNTDSEVIIHAYEEFGEKCLKLFNGMFAFCVYDSNKKRLFLARDRLGIKPLYYYLDKKKLVFASEIKSILEYPKIDKSIEKIAVYEYISLRYTLSEKTLLSNVKKILPGTYMIISEKKIIKKRYWSLSTQKKRISFSSAKKKFNFILDSSIKKRMISDVAIGAFLSGGLDSSAIVAFLSKYNKKVKTFTIAFSEGNKYDERKYANLIVKKFKTDHHESILNIKDYTNTIKKLIWHRDGPLEVPNEIAIYFMSKELKKYFTVVLSGEGADELFAGYPKYDRYKLYYILNKLLRFLPNKIVLRSIKLISKKTGRGHTFSRVIENLLNNKSSEFFYHLYFNDDITLRLLTNKMKHIIKESPIKKDFLNSFKKLNQMKVIDRLLYYDAKNHLVSLLMRIDKMTMAASVEGRVPFLDHEVFEFITQMPYNYKKRYRTNKYLLKESLKGIIPKKIINRKKVGFRTPIEKWIEGPLKDYARKILLSKKCLNRGYFNKNEIIKLIESPYSKTEYVWRLINLELWFRIFIDKTKN